LKTTKFFQKNITLRHARSSDLSRLKYKRFFSWDDNDRACRDLRPVHLVGLHWKSFGFTRGYYLSMFSLHEIFSAGQLGAFRFPFHDID